MDDNVDEESEKFSYKKSSASGCCLAFACFFANFNLALLIKVLLIKKLCVLPITYWTRHLITTFELLMNC